MTVMLKTIGAGISPLINLTCLSNPCTSQPATKPAAAARNSPAGSSPTS